VKKPNKPQIWIRTGAMGNRRVDGSALIASANALLARAMTRDLFPSTNANLIAQVFFNGEFLLLVHQEALRDSALICC
jgi:hypothetical protein